MCTYSKIKLFVPPHDTVFSYFSFIFKNVFIFVLRGSNRKKYILGGKGIVRYENVCFCSEKNYKGLKYSETQECNFFLTAPLRAEPKTMR